MLVGLQPAGAHRNEIANAFAQIDVQLKRRYDLIPNLVEVARKYVQHERDTLEAVIAARNGASSASDAARPRPPTRPRIGALGSAEGALAGMLGTADAVGRRGLSRAEGRRDAARTERGAGAHREPHRASHARPSTTPCSTTTTPRSRRRPTWSPGCSASSRRRCSKPTATEAERQRRARGVLSRTALPARSGSASRAGGAQSTRRLLVLFVRGLVGLVVAVNAALALAYG